MTRLRQRILERPVPDTVRIAGQLRELSLPLEGWGHLDPLIERIGSARYVLLGEASHGTSEYYAWRARLSKRLIQEKGFSFIAVEGDWPDCYRVNRYVKGRLDSGANARAVLEGYERWPTWMWANWEIVALSEWLRRHNDARPPDQRVGFYGLDVYSLWDSLHATLNYLRRVAPEALEVAERAYRCFEPFGQDGGDYAQATAFVPHSCEDEVVAMLDALRRAAPRHDHDGREAFFEAEQNALVVKNAENYYRTMMRGDAESWNVRDHHMVETLERLMQFHGRAAKAIVWEHNTHIGDARATDMAEAGMVNVGQLVRAQHRADDAVLVGFGSHRGTVIAGRRWGAPLQRMTMPAAREGSWEDAFHQAAPRDGLLIFEEPATDADLLAPRAHRAIGVVYDPRMEHYGNYVPTVLPRRYDAFIYLDETMALHPLHDKPPDQREPPETYPWGV
jgi:erythromycin esterase-like protein